jgi:hypothetical protein
MSCLKYITETKIITGNTTLDSFANSITFYNTGTNTCFVDGIKITSGTSFTILGNRDEMNIKFYAITFRGAGNPELTIVYKKYVK